MNTPSPLRAAHELESGFNAPLPDEFFKLIDGLTNYDEIYEETANFLLIGDFGSGKTTMGLTAPAPILLFLFDVGGAQIIRQEVEKKRVNVINLTGDDPRRPMVYLKYAKIMDYLTKNPEVTKKFGTIMVDSLTEFCECMMARILYQDSGGKRRAPQLSLDQGSAPQIQDYNIEGRSLRMEMSRLCALPTNVVVTAHLEYDHDDLQRRYASLLTTKKTKTKIPIIFSENYVLQANVVNGKKEVKVLTATHNEFRASTRIGSKNLFDINEKPDISYLLNKAGYPSGDKPLISFDPAQLINQ